MGPSSHTVEVLEAMLRAGMVAVRVDLTWGGLDFHRATLAALNVSKKKGQKSVGPCIARVSVTGSGAASVSSLVLHKTNACDICWPLQTVVTNRSVQLCGGLISHADVTDVACCQQPGAFPALYSPLFHSLPPCFSLACAALPVVVAACFISTMQQAMVNCKKLCAVILDTLGREIMVRLQSMCWLLRTDSASHCFLM